MCKIPGCTKRYTDPSSLRKHVKTVHGPDAHVTKKHRGDAAPGRALPTPSAPPDMKQESDANAPPEARKDDSRLLVPDLALVRSWGGGGCWRGEARPAPAEGSVCAVGRRVGSRVAAPLGEYSGSPPAQKPQPSPGGQSSCSSDRSPLGSATNNDSGVEMAGTAGGSYEDLSTLEDVVPGEPMGTSGLLALHKLEDLRIDKLKQMRKPAATKCLTLPAIPGAGETLGPPSRPRGQPRGGRFAAREGPTLPFSRGWPCPVWGLDDLQGLLQPKQFPVAFRLRWHLLPVPAGAGPGRSRVLALEVAARPLRRPLALRRVPRAPAVTPLLSSALPGEAPAMPAPPPAASHRRIAELSAAEMGLAPNERRSSAASTVSSAYTVSRRSSLVSPYLAGPCLGGEVGAAPSGAALADGCEPTSPDGSRRSGDAGHCGGLPGVGSLTPAQRYRLKAKYAAATGGPPPTPLPGVERAGAGGHSRLPGGYLGPAEPRFPANGLPRRRSSNDPPGYTGSAPSHPPPWDGARRASDPARTAAAPRPVPRVHRFKSVGNVSVAGAQPPGGSDADLRRHLFAPRPPSITENVFLESGPGAEPGLLEAEQYLGYPRDSFPYRGPGTELQGEGFYGSARRPAAGMRPVPGAHGGAEERLLPPEFSLPACQMSQHFGNVHAGAGAVAAPWDEPPQGHPEMSPGQPGAAAAAVAGPHCRHHRAMYPPPAPCGQQLKQALSSCQNSGFPGGHRLHRLQIKSEQHYPAPAPAPAACRGASFAAGPPQPPACFSQAVSVGPAGYAAEEPAPLGSLGMASPGARGAPAAPTKEALVRSYVQAQQALAWGEQQLGTGAGEAAAGLGGHAGQCHAATTRAAPPYLGPGHSGYQARADQSLQALPEPQHLLTAPCFTPETLPHPPGSPKPPVPPNGLSYAGSPAQPGHCYGGAGRHVPRMPPARPAPGDALLYQPGQGAHPRGGKGEQKPPAPGSCGGTGHCGGAGHCGGSSCYYLDVGEQVGNSLDCLDLENTHLDFAAIVEDAEAPALVPGPPSPASSLLLAAPGGANMAVGDMSSLLSALAGESHFLSSLS